MKKGFSFGIIALLLSITLSACSTQQSVDTQTPSGSSKGAKPNVVRVGYQVIPNTEAIAKQEGWHEKDLNGIKVQWLSFDSGKDVNTAMASGAIDLAVLGSSPTSNGIASGIPYEVIWIADVEGDNEALAVKSSLHAKNLSDLKGKTIATPFGSTTHFSLTHALDQEKIDPNQLKVLDMSPDAILAAWTRGDIDAAYVWEPTLSKLVQAGGSILLTSRELAQKGIVTADLIVARKSFAEQYPSIVASYLKGEIQAYQLYQNHPDQAADAIAKQFSISKDQAAKELKELIWLSPTEQLSGSYLGKDGAKGQFAGVLTNTAEFLAKQKVIQATPSTQIYQNAIQPKYLEQAIK